MVALGVAAAAAAAVAVAVVAVVVAVAPAQSVTHSSLQYHYHHQIDREPMTSKVYQTIHLRPMDGRSLHEEDNAVGLLLKKVLSCYSICFAAPL